MSHNDLTGNQPSYHAYDALVVGAGFAGSVLARELAERGGKRVAVIEARDHVGGNAYDYYDDAGVLVHAYGPHIFHSENKRAFDYLRRFTAWRDYQHEVLANVHGAYLPVPFNKNSLEIAFPAQKAARLIDKLVATFGDERKVSITELRAQDDPELAEVADYVYENVFLRYTQKQWGLTPEEVDPSVTARVPVFISRDNRYFQDAYQGMPLEGYTVAFERMLDHENITVYTGVDARDVLLFEADGTDQPFSRIIVEGKPYEGTIIYTGPLDELCGTRFGRLPYRSLDFAYKTENRKHVLPCGTVNYTVSEEYTRITEFTYLTGQDLPCTTIMEEYPRAYTAEPGQIPYYAIISDANRQHYERYRTLLSNCPDFHPVGRLAEYRYFNMDVIIGRTLELADTLCTSV